MDIETIKHTLGESVFKFGKYSGELLTDVWETDPNYVRWMAQDGPGILNAALNIWIELNE